VTSDRTGFREKLDALIGKPTGGSGKPTVAPDPVNQPMIRHWAHALADMNPVYLDPEFEGIAERGGVPIEIDKSKNPAEFINDAGFTGIVATNSEFEIERYPRLGDVISVTTVYEDISDEKKTSLGTGHFVTWLSTYTDQHGEVLGRQRFRVFRFKAGAPSGTAGD
jgi:uncharacterized protein